jgi:hypothetical protein
MTPAFPAGRRSGRSRFVCAITFLACLVGHASTLSAQGIEVTPFGGYRFGGDFFELLTGQPLDIDGAPSVGVIVGVPTGGGYFVEGLFTHQSAHVLVPTIPLSAPVQWRLTVDHWQAGGLQEFDIRRPRVRPFLTGALGLTRYAGDRDDNEFRFTLSAGGGVKLLPSRNIGVRLSGNLFATFVQADAQFFACGGGTGTCLIGFHANIVWQIEFTAGLVIRFD